MHEVHQKSLYLHHVMVDESLEWKTQVKNCTIFTVPPLQTRQVDLFDQIQPCLLSTDTQMQLSCHNMQIYHDHFTSKFLTMSAGQKVDHISPIRLR